VKKAHGELGLERSREGQGKGIALISAAGGGKVEDGGTHPARDGRHQKKRQQQKEMFYQYHHTHDHDDSECPAQRGWQSSQHQSESRGGRGGWAGGRQQPHQQPPGGLGGR
ncbi:unnamed protein product, partial [Pylaiella littoralis]